MAAEPLGVEEEIRSQRSEVRGKIIENEPEVLGLSWSCLGTCESPLRSLLTRKPPRKSRLLSFLVFSPFSPSRKASPS